MAMSAEMTTDILMLMSTMTLRVAPKVMRKGTKRVLWPQKHLQQNLSFCGRLKHELTEGGQNGGGPEDLAHECRYEEQAAHAFPVQLLEGVQHGDVTSRAHGLGEEKTTWDGDMTG